MTFYWSTAAAFLFMDFTQRPAFLMKYKIQQGKNTPPNTAKVIKVSKNAKRSEIMRQKTRLKMSYLVTQAIQFLQKRIKDQRRYVLRKQNVNDNKPTQKLAVKNHQIRF